MSNNVIVLAGGLSHERDVSLRSGRRVAQALRETGHTVVEADINASLIGTITRGGGWPTPCCAARIRS